MFPYGLICIVPIHVLWTTSNCHYIIRGQHLVLTYKHNCTGKANGVKKEENTDYGWLLALLLNVLQANFEYIFWAPSIRLHDVLNFPFISLYSFLTRNTELLVVFLTCQATSLFGASAILPPFSRIFFYPLVHLTMLKILQNPVLGDFPTHLLQPGKLIAFSVVSLYIRYYIYIYHTGYNCLFFVFTFLTHT